MRASRRRRALAAGLVVALLLGLAVWAVGKSPRPNVVLIIIDTLRADALGCYNTLVEDVSPEINALARNGVQFMDVTSQCSWTRPSIGSMLCSRYPRSVGLYRQRYDILDDRFLTLAEVLKREGYATLGITANPNINSDFNFQQGFDRYVDSAVIWEWMKPKPGQVRNQGRNRLPHSRSVFEAMLEDAKARKDSKPVYMQITIMEVHEGWRLVRPEFKRRYRGLLGVPRGYWDGIRQASHDIGRFVRELASLPGWANTLFIITSDHGQGLEDHPAVSMSWGHGLLLYESQVKVPLIFFYAGAEEAPLLRWIGSRVPGSYAKHIKAGVQRLRRRFPRLSYRLPTRRVDAPVRLMDLMPTLLDYLRLPIPDDIDGKSLLPLIHGRGSSSALPRYFVTETHFQGSDKIAVYSERWKYIENRDGHEGVKERELQRVGLRENGRLSDRIRERPDVAQEMREYLRAWEQRFPGVKPVQPTAPLAPEVLDQLRGLGYVN